MERPWIPHMMDGEEIFDIVIDNGSSVCRAGFAQHDTPKVVFPSRVARPRYQSIMIDLDKKDTFIGNETQEQRELLTINYPIERGIITNWDDMEKIWQHAFTKLDVPIEEFGVLLTEATLNPLANREKMAQVMFEKFNVPAFYVATQGVLSLYASGFTTGVVCTSGDGGTYIVPVFEDCLIAEAVQRMEVSGRDLTYFLPRLLQEKGHSFTTTTDMEIVKDMKEKLCYVAQDFEGELNRWDLEESYDLPDGTSVTLGNERIKCPEALFQPSLIGLDKRPGIHEHVFNSIMRCEIDSRKRLYNRIVVSGGNSFIPGFADRLKREMKSLAPSSMEVKIFAYEDRMLSAFIGGSILASVQSTRDMWISKAEYEEYGPLIVHRKCCI